MPTQPGADLVQRWMADPNYILLLEDHGETARLITTLIEEDLAIRVQVVEDGVSALNAVEAAIPLLVIVDLMVPVLDGEQFMHIVRRRYGTTIRLVVLSALAEPEVQAVAERADARAVTKPFDLEELVTAVAEAVMPPFVAALDRRPQRGAADVLVRSLRSDAELLAERSHRLLAHARTSLDETKMLSETRGRTAA